MHMLISANTTKNLELLANETDHTSHGSLLALLDQTKTKFGSRLLRQWVSKPLTDKRSIHGSQITDLVDLT
jgi:DNA mismatch repair protein MSH3